MFKNLIAVLFLAVLLAVPVLAQAAPQATATWNAVTTSITGQPVTGVTYNIYRSLNADGSVATKLNGSPIALTTYVDTTLLGTTTYYFQVSGVNTDGVEGAKSVIVRFNFSDKIPAAATGFTLK